MPRLLKLFILIFSFSFLVFRFSNPVISQPQFPPVDKNKVVDLANRWFGNQPLGHHRVNEYFDTILNQSIAAGIDPGITFSIWLHESGASNYLGICQKFGSSQPDSDYCQKVQDFGINNPAIETTYNVSGAVIADHFQDQLSAFLNLSGYYARVCDCADMNSFFAKFRTGSQCMPSACDLAYLEKIKNYYSIITHSAPFPLYPQPSIYKSCNFSLNVSPNQCGSSANTSAPANNLLRPNPFALVKEEKQRQISDPNLAPFCAYRPTVVQNVLIDKRQKKITVSGSLTTDFRSFTTPFLSAPGGSVGDQRYLADYLEGTAYYLTAPDPKDLTQVLDRLGVFRKLAPASYQDQLKNAMISRASGSADADAVNQAYGFLTATTQIHDYELNTPYGKFKLSQLEPKPLDNPDALALWQNSTTAKVWPYVPMFTREDTKGFIQSLPEPGQVSSPQVAEVIHPHLARTYEVSSTIANLLSPESTHQFQPPDLPVNWVQPPPWTTDSHWIDSSKSVPAEYGPVCDPQSPTKVIAGSGDLAANQSLNTAVFKQIANPYYDPACDKGGNPSDCFLSQEYRFSPVYLKTFTPFLDQITFNLLTGPSALFGIFNLTNEKPTNWPAVGTDSQKAPAYSFSNGQAESGLKKPGKPAQYLYNYLGTLHCQKEKLIAVLQPFLTGTTYNLPPECDINTSTQTTLTATCLNNYPTASVECSLCNIDAPNQYMANVGYPKIPEKMKAIFEAAAQQYNVPASIIIGVMFAEGGFEREACYGKWTDETICAEEIPHCRECNISSETAIGPYQFIMSWFPNSDINPCNFESATFATARNLSRDRAGYGDVWSDKSCNAGKYGEITYNQPNIDGFYASSCTAWTIKDVVTAARARSGICNPLYFERITDFWKTYSCY